MTQVLVTDDEPSLLEIAKAFLEKRGHFKVDTATSAIEAQSMMGGTDYDAIVCDYMMPEMNGLELLKRLRQDGNHIPFILFTGRGREDVAIEALNLGADFYLQKGGDPKTHFAELVNMINQSVSREKMERAVAENEERYRAIFETTGSGMVLIGDASEILLVNSEFERISGFKKDELVGKRKWTDLMHPDDLSRVLSYHKARMKDPRAAPTTYEFRGMDRDGGVHHLLAFVTVLPGTRRTLVSVLDLTEKKHQEEALHVANKKLSLLGGITRHDILNQLSVMYGYVELTRREEQDPAKRERLDKALASGDMIRRHLEFSRDYQSMGTARPDWTDVHAVIDRVFRSLDAKDLRLRDETRGLEVFSDPMLEKVFYNLMDNTLRHSGGAKNIRVRYRTKGEELAIVFEDDGRGVPEEDKDVIFERGTEKHAGFGLYLAREILGITGMTIKESGIAGEGARFEILVPRGGHRRKESTDQA